MDSVECNHTNHVNCAMNATKNLQFEEGKYKRIIGERNKNK